MPLKVTYQGNETVIEDDATASIGSDAVSTIRIVRPGISRRHAVVSHGDSGWTIEDTGSRNGSYRFGQRFDSIGVNQSETIYLGHPTDGERLTLTPLGGDSGAEKADPAAVETFILPPSEPSAQKPAPAPSEAGPKAKTTSEPSVPSMATLGTDERAARSRAQRTPREVDLAELTVALRDQINAVKGLTWSVWAMIAVTAALAVMTLFVGILGS